jgi:DNA (cytosine-5)-methyltransferase 1
VQLNLNIHRELLVDNFAGGGGASCGIESALGRRVDIAINHDPRAVAMHQANHPETQHYCESVWDIRPAEVTQGRPVGLVWLSPDCKHFSKAKGGKPVDKNIRGLAWVALRWAATVQPRVIMLENVEEFITWGPLVEADDGTLRPCPKRKGQNFRSFLNALRRQGYAVEHRELKACDYGAPTIRKRLFLVARRDGQPIVWPAATHADPKQSQGRGLKTWRTAAECIDFTQPCPSIFERARPLADATLRRVAKGVQQFVNAAEKTFIVGVQHFGEVSAFLTKYYGCGVGQSLHDPLHTVTSHDRYGLVTVAGDHYQIADIGLRMLSPRELFNAQGFPAGYQIGDDPAQGLSLTKAEQVRMCGNSVSPPVAAALVAANLGEMRIRRTG